MTVRTGSSAPPPRGRDDPNPQREHSEAQWRAAYHEGEAEFAAPASSTRDDVYRGKTRARALADKALIVVVVLLLYGGARALIPLWAPLVLAAWFALVARPLHRRMARWMRGQHRSAGVVTVLLVIAVLAPVTIVVLSLAGDAVALVRRVVESPTVPEKFRALFETGDQALKSPDRLFDMARQHGASALDVARMVAGATVAAIIALVVFVMGFYVFLVHGRRIYGWFVNHAPLRRRHVRSLVGAFNETGRGLLIGVGLTALLQGAVASIGYVIASVPHALVLGLLTAIAALIPSIGTGLVWVPVAAALAFSGKTGPAILVLVIGSIVSITDNFVRPYLSRHAKLKLPTFALFVAMLGGMMAFGGWGLLLGPLFLRLAVEALTLLRQERDLAAGRPPRVRATADAPEPSSKQAPLGGARAPAPT